MLLVHIAAAMKLHLIFLGKETSFKLKSIKSLLDLFEVDYIVLVFHSALLGAVFIVEPQMLKFFSIT